MSLLASGDNEKIKYTKNTCSYVNIIEVRKDRQSALSLVMCPKELYAKGKLEWSNVHKMQWVNRVEAGLSVKLVAVVVSVLMTGSCDALPTPTLAPLFTNLPEHALETPRRGE